MHQHLPREILQFILDKSFEFFVVFFFFFSGLYIPRCMACGILVPQPGIEPWAPAAESSESTES